MMLHVFMIVYRPSFKITLSILWTFLLIYFNMGRNIFMKRIPDIAIQMCLFKVGRALDYGHKAHT